MKAHNARRGSRRAERVVVSYRAVRCPTCYRRLHPTAPCPTHPEHVAPAAEVVDEAAPSIDGLRDYGLLGSGGFSRVWSAKDAADRDVAIKVALTRNDVRFAREAEIMRHLGSKVCPELYDQGQTESGHQYLVMELIKGKSVADWLADCEGMPPAYEAMTLFAKLCEVVQRMHESGVLHRDLKPENVVLLQDGNIRVLDLGLARYLSDSYWETAELSLTQTGALLGTVAYIAPEQSLGRKNLKEQTDIYTLAIMGFELLTGRVPYVGTRSAILQAHVWEKPPHASRLVAVTPAVDKVLIRGLAKDPDLRWTSASELGASLLSCVAAMPAPEQEVTTSKRSSRRPMALLAIHGSMAATVVQKAAASVGGQIARTTSDGFVLVFATASSLTLGVDAAIAVACEIRPLATRCVVHVATLRTRTGARGVMVLGDAVKKSDTWSGCFGAGMFATSEAADLVGPSSIASREQGGHLVLQMVDPSTPTGAGTEIDWQSYTTEVRPWGRDDLIRAIETDLRTVLDTRSALLTTVIGDVGLGKSHLAHHLLDRLGEWNELRVIHIRGADSDDEGKSNTLLQCLVREAFGLFEPKPSRSTVEKACLHALGAEASSEAWPVVAQALDVLDTAEFAKVCALIGLTATRQALARAVAEALIGSAEKQPIAVIVDDVHRADYTTLDALELATLGEGPAPLWVLAVAGPQLDELKPNWAARASCSSRYQLAPLDDEAARGMLLQLLFPVEFVPESVISALIELTHGIPLYLEEVANTLKQNGVIRQRAGTESWFVASDELILASKTPLGERLAHASLGSMRDDLALFAKLCAVIGQGITCRVVDAAQTQLDAELGFSAVDPGAGLKHLEERRLLRRVSEGAYEFRHPIMREALEALVPLALRRVLHAAVLRGLNCNTAPASQIARHAEFCGNNRLAAEKYMEVASSAEAQFRYVEAEQAYSSVLANVDSESTEVREKALTGRGRVHYCVGRHDDALQDLRAAMEVAEAREDNVAVAEMLLEISTILDWKFQYSESAIAARKAIEVTSSQKDPHLKVRCDLAIARSTFREQRVSEAIVLLSGVESKAEELKEYSTRVIALALLGGALASVDRLDEAEQYLNSMEELSRKVGDRFHLAVAYANRMHVWSARYDYNRAIEDARQAMAVAKEIGAFPIIWVCQHTLAELLMWLGNYEEAASIASKAREIQHRFTDQPDPDYILLVARIKVASNAAPGSASDELDYLHSNYKRDDLLPSHRVQTRMIELWEREESAEVWRELLGPSKDCLRTNEQLELLLAYGRAAMRGGYSDDVARATTLAHDIADLDSLWLQHFDALRGKSPV